MNEMDFEVIYDPHGGYSFQTLAVENQTRDSK